MSHRRGQIDMAHALAAHLGQRNLGAALFAFYAAVLHALVFSAQTLVVLHGPKDGRAEKPLTLGAESPVVNGFRLLDFAERPGTNQLRRRQTDANCIEIGHLALTLVSDRK